MSFSYAQTDSCNLRISLLTCGPGDELYSIFGHTAIRVRDTVKGYDAVYNYGTFDDSDPLFYLKFTRGIMRYALSAESFRDFMQEYLDEKRSVTEQVLSLDCAEKKRILNALEENLQESNRYYNYHFYQDNCTTRAKEMIQKTTDHPFYFKNILPPQAPSYRKLIHDYLDKGGQPWSKFGIDFLLGSHLDEKVSNEQSMFLPDYLMKGIDSAGGLSLPLVYKKQVILAAGEKKEMGGSLFTPMIFFTFLSIVFIALSFSKSKKAGVILFYFDWVFFFLLGLLGILLVFVWLGRVDAVCRNNYNLLWAWPTHALIVFWIKGKKTWVVNYFRLVVLVSLALLASWAWLPQQLNNASLPLVILILVRSIFQSRNK
jgi:hypothetical protein